MDISEISSRVSFISSSGLSLIVRLYLFEAHRWKVLNADALRPGAMNSFSILYGRVRSSLYKFPSQNGHRHTMEGDSLSLMDAMHKTVTINLKVVPEISSWTLGAGGEGHGLAVILQLYR